jgi:hypothetical protein
VRKVVRAIIEHYGGDGAKVKSDMETNHKKGIVWFKGVRAAEWDADTGKMALKGETAMLQEAYDALMR